MLFGIRFHMTGDVPGPERLYSCAFFLLFLLNARAALPDRSMFVRPTIQDSNVRKKRQNKEPEIA